MTIKWFNKGNLKSLDYILPIANTGGSDFEDRLQNLNLVLNKFLNNQSNINLTVYLIEQIINPNLPTYQQFLKIPNNLNIVIKTVEYPVFVKPWLYNIGIKISSGENIIFGDMDAFSNEDYFYKLVEFVDDRKSGWCFGWDKAVQLSQKRKEQLLNTGIIDLDKNGLIIPEDKDEFSYLSPLSYDDMGYIVPKEHFFEGYIVLFKRDFFISNLFYANELFRGLGENDNELIYRAKRISSSYDMYPITILHLWHPRSNMKNIGEFWPNVRLFTYMRCDNNCDKINAFLKTKNFGNDLSPFEIDFDFNSKTLPTLEEQGYDVSTILSNKKSSRTTFCNGSVEEMRDNQYIFITNNISHVSDDKKIEIYNLDNNFTIIKTKLLDLKKNIPANNIGNPKLIYHNDMIYCSYMELNHQHLCILDNKFNIIKDIYIHRSDNTTYEGNMNFFFYDDKLHFIHSIEDHSVIEIDLSGNILKEYRMNYIIPEIYSSNVMYSGSAPKLYDKDHYIVFFNTWDKCSDYSNNNVKVNYSISAYLFENKPPFHIKKMTKPMIYGSPYNTVKDPLIERGYIGLDKNIPGIPISNSRIVFSTGVIFKDDYMLVSVGLNDVDTKLVKVTREDIEKNLIDYDFRTPTIKELGYSVFDICGINKLSRDGFKNGSIERINKYEFIFAVGSNVHSKYNDGNIEMCKLDEDFNVVSLKILNLPKTIVSDIVEDCRLIYHNDLIYCAYIESFNHNQMLVILDSDFNIINEISLKYGNNHTCPIHTGWWGCGKWEKNWNFFFHDNKFYFIYSIENHIVVEIDPEDGTVLNEYRMDEKMPDMYNGFYMHSGSPPKLYDKDHYITFFHNWDKTCKDIWISHSRPYRISAYLFENKPPFHIKKMTKPMIYGSPYNTERDPASDLYDKNIEKNYFGCSRVVFPTGVIFKDDYMLVSVGLNDVDTKLVKVTREDIEKNLIDYDFKM